jgi:OFA family oxalate/formate antiporter-like MFS transporter
MERSSAAPVRVVPFFYGWWVVIAAATIILIASIAPLYLFSTLVDPLEEEFGWSRAAIGAGPSIAAVMAGLTLPVAGYLVDRVGARRLLVAGVLLVGGGFLAMSQIQALWQFYISASIIAVGMSLAGLPVCTVAIAHWFVKRRGRALGIVTAGEGASGVMVLVAALLIAVFEWRTGLMILGSGQLAICIPLALTVRNRPDEVGLLPDGEPPASGEPSSGLPPEPADGTSQGSGMRQPEGLTTGQALRTRSFWLLAFAQVLAWVGSFAIVIHVIAYLDESGGFTEEGAAVIAMGIPFGSLVGRLGFGWLADYLGKRWLLAAAWILQGLGTLIFAGIHSPWQAAIFLIVFTPGWGGAAPLLPALLAEYFGLRAFGAIQGVLMATAMLGAIAGPIFAGAVYDVVDSYRPAFLLLALAAFTAVVLVQMMGRRPAWGTETADAPVA